MYSQMSLHNIAIRCHVVLSICIYWTAAELKGRGCVNIHTAYISFTSLVARSDTSKSNLDFYHRGLSCRDDPGCRAITEMTIGNVEAVCSATPGLIQTAGMYIVLRDSHIPGNLVIMSRHGNIFDITSRFSGWILWSTPHKIPEMRSFCDFFVVSMNNLLHKKPKGRRTETP